MAYNILQEFPDVALGLVQHLTDPRRVSEPGVWSGPIRQDAWTLDYCGWEGMHCAVEAGSVEFAPFRRPPGSWHLYAPGVAYHERYDAPKLRREDMWFHFTLRRPFRPFSARPFTALADPEERLAPHVRALYALQQLGEPGSELLAHGLLLTILGEIVSAARRGGRGIPADPWRVRGPESVVRAERESLLHRLDAAVCRRLSAPPSLDELAETLNLSVSSLAHRLKVETGRTVIARVRWLRIREARRLLSRPGATAKSVAARLGFSSPAYFSRVFTDVTGITPAAYVRSRRG